MSSLKSKNLIRENGWIMLCAQPTVGYHKLAQEFYANAFRVDNDNLGKNKTMVRDVDIDYSPKIIREFFSIQYSP